MQQSAYPKCKCTTSDGKIVVAGPSTVKWCKFLKNMLEDIGVDNNENIDDDNNDNNAIVMCDYNMFNFVNQFCKFYDNAPYDYAVIDEINEQGKVTRKADIVNGRPLVKFEPLFEMAQRACKSDTKKYNKRKSAWNWFSKALDAAEYFDCDPLIIEVNRSIAYILTGLDHQAIHKITDIEPDEWIKAANEVLQERINKSTPKLNHTEIFDAIYKTIAPPAVAEDNTNEPANIDINVDDYDITAQLEEVVTAPN